MHILEDYHFHCKRWIFVKNISYERGDMELGELLVKSLVNLLETQNEMMT